MTDQVHVTFIHGLANKPPPDELRRVWLEALATQRPDDPGFDLAAVNVSSSFVYWADLFYSSPLPPGEYENNSSELEQSFGEADDVVEAADDEEAAWLRALEARFPADDFEDAPTDETTAGYERIPVPGFVKKRVMRRFVKEAHDYLWNVNGIRDTIRQRVVDDFAQVPAGHRHVLLGHSQGTFIGYDVLTGVPECKGIDGFMTVGSPLGIDEIQDRLVTSRQDGFPSKLKGDWVNVYDPFDVVSRLDPVLANDFKKDGRKVIVDVKEENWGTWRHSASKYFQGDELRAHLRRLCAREAA